MQSWPAPALPTPPS